GTRGLGDHAVQPRPLRARARLHRRLGVEAGRRVVEPARHGRAADDGRGVQRAAAAVTTPDLVLLGNLLVDDVGFADGRTRMGQPGGAMLYAALAASLWGVSTGCVSLRGDDYPSTALDELRARGVALDGVHALHRNGVRTWLLYEGAIRRVIHRLG